MEPKNTLESTGKHELLHNVHVTCLDIAAVNSEVIICRQWFCGRGFIRLKCVSKKRVFYYVAKDKICDYINSVENRLSFSHTTLSVCVSLKEAFFVCMLCACVEF